jgi:hypothetical protein
MAKFREISCLSFLVTNGLFFFIGVRVLVVLLLGYERLSSFKGIRELRCALVEQKRNYRT